MKRYILFFLVFTLCLATNAFALSVTTTNNATTLTNTILGPGITLVGTPTYTGAAGAAGAAGTFTGGISSGIGIDSGIILTSGSASLAVGPNDQDSAGVSNGYGGDSDLGSLIPGYSTFNTAKIEFDFTTTGGDLFFNYVFASEEYNEYANTSYNDVFGFFLDGTNIALIPSTTTPVSINNVNGGNPYGFNAQNSGYYNNNDPSNGVPTPYNIQYDGFTDVFTAKALGLSAGIHHIKLAIADAGDTILDSAVFIQGGTFSDTETPVPEPGTILLLGSGLAGLGLFRRKVKKA